MRKPKSGDQSIILCSLKGDGSFLEKAIEIVLIGSRVWESNTSNELFLRRATIYFPKRSKIAAIMGY